MKSLTLILVGCFLVTVAFTPASFAQVPTISIYADEELQERNIESCPGWGIIDTFYVVAEGFNMSMASIEYRIDLSIYLTFLGDFVTVGVMEGYSIDGIRITYPTPVDASGRLLVEMIVFRYECSGCEGFDGRIFIDELNTVVPHPESGKIQAFRWPDMAAVEGEGMASILCRHVSIPVKETTWGMIKAFYH